MRPDGKMDLKLSSRRDMAVTRHILIVDDKPRVAFFLSTALERLNQDYRVSVAHSGEGALEILGSRPVDLLVTDLCMPGITGLELIRWVKASSPQTRTILITAHDNDDAKVETDHLDTYRYITKPFAIDDFIEVVEDALHDVATDWVDRVTLPEGTLKAITQELKSLRYDINALCIFLANRQGQPLTVTGDTSDLDAVPLLSLLAEGFTFGDKLARQFSSGQATNLNFHEGSRYDIYSTSVGDDFFLAIIYDRRVQASRIGIVWLYTRRAVENMRHILLTTAVPMPDQSPDARSPGSPSPKEEESVPTLPLEWQGTPAPNCQSRTEESPAGVADAELHPPVKLGSPQPGKISPAQPTKGNHSDISEPQDEPERELLDMKTAIALGLIPADLGSK